MPRYAIKQARALHTIYREADDALDAVNAARRALIDHAKHGELFVVRLHDEQHDEGDAQSELRYEETEDDRETERAKGLRLGLFATEGDGEELEPW